MIFPGSWQKTYSTLIRQEQHCIASWQLWWRYVLNWSDNLTSCRPISCIWWIKSNEANFMWHKCTFETTLTTLLSRKIPFATSVFSPHIDIWPVGMLRYNWFCIAIIFRNCIAITSVITIEIHKYSNVLRGFNKAPLFWTWLSYFELR